MKHLLKFSFLASVLVHLGLMLSFHISQYLGESRIPIGVQIKYSGAGAASKPDDQVIQKKQKLKVTENSNVTLKKQKKLLKKKSKQNYKVGQKIQGQARGQQGSVNGSEVSALDRYQYDFQKFVESRMYYPSKAKKLYQTGKVLLKVEIDRSGEILLVETVKKCPFHTLNKAAVKMVKGIMKFKAFPLEVKEQKIAVILPVEYIL